MIDINGVMMAVFKILDGDHLDYDAFTNLQQEAYSNLLARLKVSNVYISPKFYQWKFYPPAGPAKIVLFRESIRKFIYILFYMSC